LSSVNFLLGKTLGKYGVLEHIGHGGMAEVYKGQHVQLDRMVAIKVLHPFLADDDGFVVRFQREARIVATLRHPNIVQVYDFDYHDELNIYYMVMEYIDGPTLKSVLSGGGRPQDEVLRFGAAIADAMAYAHRRGMVHRDVKPANIMFTSDNMPILTDFGIAKMLTLTSLTASGAMVGTPAFMAPEIGMGKPGTGSTDIYALGVVLYQMVTGRLPFESESPMGMVMQHINDAPPPPSQFAPNLSKEFEAAILRALEKQPEARFASAEEMARELRKLAGIETPRRVMTASLPRGNAAALLRAAEETLAGTLDTPAFTPPVLTQVPPEEDERLVRTWPPESVTPLSAVITPEDAAAGTADAKKKRSFIGRLFRTMVILLVSVAVLTWGWVALGGYIPPQITAYIPGIEESARLDLERLNLQMLDLSRLPLGTVALPAEASATPIAVERATVLTATETPTPAPTSTPAPTLIPAAVCAPRLKLEQMRLNLGAVVPPETQFMTQITLRNTGDCAWPEGLTLQCIAGEPLSATETVPISALAPRASVQVQLAMTSGAELRDYESRWEVRQTDGQLLGSAILVRVTVGDVPLPTPPPDAPAIIIPEILPLVVGEPIRAADWTEDVTTGRWQGTLTLTSTGGTGVYRYYRGIIRANTLLPDGQLVFEGQRCISSPLVIEVLSGNDRVRWHGLIPYPAPERCP